VDDKERNKYEQLIETIGWFFFDLFILGYVEDPVTGNSFRFPGGMQWAVYVEVSRGNGHSDTRYTVQDTEIALGYTNCTLEGTQL